MPLPSNGVLSLQGHSRPGDTQYSKPKHAILFRFPGDAMDRLQAVPNQPKIQVELGENPGLHIGDQFLPMRIDKEAAAHELYLRSSLPNKPGGSLKLYANITAKAIFVDRKLGEKIQSTVRERTEAAEKQRTGNKIKLLDAPLAPVNAKTATIKKRKDAIANRRVAVVDAHRTLSAPSTAQQSRVPSPRPAASSSKYSDPTVRPRLVHYVALQPRTKEDVVRCVAGRDAVEQAKQFLLELLSEVCERVPSPKGVKDTQGEKWQLKTASWLEVRPYSWPHLSQQERTHLARHARTAFHTLKIPETDPRWENVRYREAGVESGALSGSGSAAETKRPATKNKQPEAVTVKKKVNSDAIIAKDEGSRAKAESTAQSNGTASRNPARRPLGSGLRTESAAPATESIPKRSEVKRDREAPALPSSSSARPIHPPPPPREERPVAAASSSSTRIPKRERDSDAASRIAESDRESRRGSPLPPPGLKRKKPRDERDREPGERETVSAPKRRKVEGEPSAKAHARDLSLPKKPIVKESVAMAPPRQKYKKEPSATPSLRDSTPLPPTNSPLPSMSSPLLSKPSVHQDRVPSASSTAPRRGREERHSRNGSAKLRRKSPIYTSSEDESESQRRVAVKREADEDARPAKQPKPVVLPDNIEGLQRLYTKKYPKYIQLFYEKEAARRRMTELLSQQADPEDEDPNSVPCDEEDLETLNLDAIRELHARYMHVANEMQSIIDAHNRLVSLARTSSKRPREED